MPPGLSKVDKSSIYLKIAMTAVMQSMLTRNIFAHTLSRRVIVHDSNITALFLNVFKDTVYLDLLNFMILLGR